MTAGAWIALALAVGAIAVVVVLALVGATSLFRAVPGERMGTAPAAASPEFVGVAGPLLGASFSSGASVEIVCNGDGTFPRLWADLEEARREIRFAAYYGESGRIADRTFEIFRRKRAQGVRVRFLYDPIGFRGMDRRAIEALRGAGVECHRLRPLRLRELHRFNHRVHARLVNVDGRIGYTGAFGLSDRWSGDGRTAGSWRDTNARLSGPPLQRLDGAFASLWMEGSGELISSLYHDSAQGERLAALLYSDPGVGSTPTQRLWALSLAAARQRAHFTSGYFAPTRELVELLAATAARGVEVRVLTARAAHTDVPPAYWAGRASYPALLAAGVRIWEYEPSMVHAKTLVVDGVWSAVGAINYDNRSVALNTEAALLMHDREMGERLEAIFRDDLALSREVRLEDVRGCPWRDRARAYLAERVVRLL